jgi:hypothetical protein
MIERGSWCADSPRLSAANIGDSGFIVLRRAQDFAWSVVAQSKEQTVGFNTPRQLGSIEDRSDQV